MEKEASKVVDKSKGPQENKEEDVPANLGRERQLPWPPFFLI